MRLQRSGLTSPSFDLGEVVWGMWGHRSHAVLPAERLRGQALPDGMDPMVGTFARVGAVALNAVLASGACVGETVVVFGLRRDRSADHPAAGQSGRRGHRR